MTAIREQSTTAREPLPGEGREFVVEEYEDREAWLAARRSAITGSDAAGLWAPEIAERSASYEARVTPLQVYARKVAGEDDHDALNLEIGRALEPVIRARYERETGKRVVYPGPFAILRSLAHPHLAVSLDGAVPDFDGPSEPAVWEAKAWTGGAHLWRESIPMEIEAQVRHGMVVTDWPVAVVAAIIVGRWTVRHVAVDEDFAALHVARAAALWARIEAREEPEATGADLEAIGRLHAKAKAETIALDGHAAIHAAALEVAKGEQKQIEAAIKYHDARLRQAIGDFEAGELPDGTVYTLKNQKRAAFTVEATEFRVLRKKGERA